MKFLKSKRAWERWCKAEYFDRPDAPSEYPCWGYVVVASFAYEETEPRYLYLKDLQRMTRAIKLNANESVTFPQPTK